MPRQTVILPPAIPHAAKRHAGRTRADATPLQIRGHHVTIDSSLERYVRMRTSRKLGKFAHEEQRITVRFEDLNGPKGGLAIACRIEILVPAAPTILVEDRAKDPRDAFDLAIDEAERAVRHSLDRRARAQGKPRRGEKRVAALDAAARREAQEGRTAKPEANAQQTKTRRHPLARPSRATAALEATTGGKPSRKSTRKSANRVLQATELHRRQVQAVSSPEARAVRGKPGGRV